MKFTHSSLQVTDHNKAGCLILPRVVTQELIVAEPDGLAEQAERECMILAEAKFSVRHRPSERISGFVVPRIAPLKVSSDKLGTLAEIYKRGSRFEPRSSSAGVIVTNPGNPATGTGTGYLTVVWTASQVGLAGQANWWINPASPHPIPTNGFLLGVGNATVTFGPLAGYTAPAPVLIHIWKGQVTTLTVTYGQP